MNAAPTATCHESTTSLVGPWAVDWGLECPSAGPGKIILYGILPDLADARDWMSAEVLSFAEPIRRRGVIAAGGEYWFDHGGPATFAARHVLDRIPRHGDCSCRRESSKAREIPVAPCG
jgi:hypothetical protein